MTEGRTEPFQPAGVPVGMIRVEVIAGPDAGKAPLADADAVTIGTAKGNDLELTDPTVSRYHLELRREGQRIRVVDHGSTNGTTIGSVLLRGGSVDVKPGTVLELGETRIRVDDGRVVVVLQSGPEAIGDLRSRTPAMRRLMTTIERVAATEVSVLILGESGTGKELVARAIHDLGPRAAEPFLTVDCGAIAPTLFASELFGHERGAFTSADRQHIGAFERAHGGTLLLDEVGELPPEIQSALLGVLERKRLRRVGGRDELQVDVRVLSATHRDLREEVNAGSFRLDLFYRLAVVLLDVPPLRDRADDIPLLVEAFLREAGHDGPVETVFPPEAMARLRSHAWPGNVRELRNVVLGTLAMGQAPDLGSPERATGDPIEASLDRAYREARSAVVDEFERRYLRRLLERTSGNIRQAAREANMDRSYLMELLKRHGLR